MSKRNHAELVHSLDPSFKIPRCEPPSLHTDELVPQVSGYRDPKVKRIFRGTDVEVLAASLAEAAIDLVHEGFSPLVVYVQGERECEACLIRLDETFDESIEKTALKKIERLVAALKINHLGDSALIDQMDTIEEFFRKGFGIISERMCRHVIGFVEALFNAGLIKILILAQPLSDILKLQARCVVVTFSQILDGPLWRPITATEYFKMARCVEQNSPKERTVHLWQRQDISIEELTKIIDGHVDQTDVSDMPAQLEVLIQTQEGLTLEERTGYYEAYKKGIQRDELGKIFQLKQEEYTNFHLHIDEKLRPFFQKLEELELVEREMQALITHPEAMVPFMVPGRLIEVASNMDYFGFCVVLEMKKIENDNKAEFFFKVAMPIAKAPECVQVTEIIPYDWFKDDGNVDIVLAWVKLDCIRKMTKLALRFPPSFREKKDRDKMIQIVRYVRDNHRVGQKYPEIHPIDDMQIKDPNLKRLIDRKEQLKTQMGESGVVGLGGGRQALWQFDPVYLELKRKFWIKKRLAQEVDDACEKLKEAEEAFLKWLEFLKLVQASRE